MSDLATLATARWTTGAVLPLTAVAAAGPCARFASRCLEPFEDQCFCGQADRASGDRPTIAVKAFVATDEPARVLETAEWTVESILVDHEPIEAAVAYAISTAGRRIVVSGDTAACRGVATLAKGADVLLHEALRSDRVPRSLLSWNASASSVGALAAAAGVSQLVLTHLLPAPRTADDENSFVAEAREGGYAGTIHVARDLVRIEVP